MSTMWANLLSKLCSDDLDEQHETHQGDHQSGWWSCLGYRTRSSRNKDRKKVRIFMAPYPPETASLQRTQEFVIKTRRDLVVGGALQLARPIVTWPIQIPYPRENFMTYDKPETPSRDVGGKQQEVKDCEGRQVFVPPCYSARCRKQSASNFIFTHDGIQLEGLRCSSPLCPYSRNGPLMLTNPEPMVFSGEEEYMCALTLAAMDWERQWLMIASNIRQDIDTPSKPQAVLAFTTTEGSCETIRDIPSASPGLSDIAYFNDRGIKFTIHRMQEQAPIQQKAVGFSTEGEGKPVTSLDTLVPADCQQESTPRNASLPQPDQDQRSRPPNRSYSPLSTNHQQRHTQARTSLELRILRPRRSAISKPSQRNTVETVSQGQISAHDSGSVEQETRPPSRSESVHKSRSSRSRLMVERWRLEYPSKLVDATNRKRSTIRSPERCTASDEWWKRFRTSLARSEDEETTGASQCTANKSRAPSNIVEGDKLSEGSGGKTSYSSLVPPFSLREHRHSTPEPKLAQPGCLDQLNEPPILQYPPPSYRSPSVWLPTSIFDHSNPETATFSLSNHADPPTPCSPWSRSVSRDYSDCLHSNVSSSHYSSTTHSALALLRSKVPIPHTPLHPSSSTQDLLPAPLAIRPPGLEPSLWQPRERSIGPQMRRSIGSQWFDEPCNGEGGRYVHWGTLMALEGV